MDIMLRFQRVYIREYIVTMGAAEWPFIMTRVFILVDIMLCFQRVCIPAHIVTMGATEWPFIMTIGLHSCGYYVVLSEGLYAPLVTRNLQIQTI